MKRKTLNKLLPAALKNHRKKLLRLSVIRKRNAHDPRLPEVQQARRQEAIRKAAAIAFERHQKKQAEAELQAAIADAPVPVVSP